VTGEHQGNAANRWVGDGGCLCGDKPGECSTVVK